MIVFQNLTFRNILSVGNQPITINLNETKTTLIHGTNGSGKSTILDALCYVLFSKSFRKINLPQLINASNKKGLLVEIEFTIGNTDYRVVRGSKPKVFEIYKNGEIVEAKAADKDNQAYLEQNILKLSYKSFIQVVILGSSNFIPFMQLPSQGRRECVEDFLDIKVFSTMSVIAKERSRGLKDSLKVLKGDVGNLEYKIDLQQQRIKEIESNTEDTIKGILNKVEQAKSLAIEMSVDISKLDGEEYDLMAEVKELQAGSPVDKSKEFTKVIIKIDNKIERLKKNISFYEDNDSCHTCHQDIQEEIKTKYITESQEQIDEYHGALTSAKYKLDDLEGRISEIVKLQDKIRLIQREVFEKTTQVKQYDEFILDCQNELTDIMSNSSSLDKERGKLEVMEEELGKLKKKALELVVQVQDHDIVVNLLKDSGIKTQIVKKYLPVMNKFIRKYLTALDLPIHFVLDGEFNESVSSPLHQDFSYASFSEGQKGRIDISLMLTWREIGKLKNSVSTNILFLDEVFSSSLDETGKELLLHLLRYDLDDSQRVIVVDHTLSSNFKEKFERGIEVSRVKGFSRYN